mmetsp:Transcript_1967/g.5543  ORF Transcript_1967/g.5543 Transcript_1967/m.5543 type:complete len:87 (-) Transcript_1967:36-296(-)
MESYDNENDDTRAIMEGSAGAEALAGAEERLGLAICVLTPPPSIGGRLRGGDRRAGEVDRRVVGARMGRSLREEMARELLVSLRAS